VGAARTQTPTHANQMAFFLLFFFLLPLGVTPNSSLSVQWTFWQPHLMGTWTKPYLCWRAAPGLLLQCGWDGCGYHTEVVGLGWGGAPRWCSARQNSSGSVMGSETNEWPSHCPALTVSSTPLLPNTSQRSPSMLKAIWLAGLETVDEGHTNLAAHSSRWICSSTPSAFTERNRLRVT